MRCPATESKGCATQRAVYYGDTVNHELQDGASGWRAVTHLLELRVTGGPLTLARRRQFRAVHG